MKHFTVVVGGRGGIFVVHLAGTSLVMQRPWKTTKVKLTQESVNKVTNKDVERRHTNTTTKT